MTGRLRLNSWQLKLLAVITMLVDHTGALLFPQAAAFRIVGRLSFPIFCLLLAEGAAHTSGKARYFLRLLLFAVLSEIPYDLAFFGSLFYPGSQNVLFELVLGLLAIFLIQKIPFRALGLLTVFGIAALAWLLHTDYKVYGVLLMVLLYLGRTPSGKLRTGTIAAFLGLNLLYCLPQAVFGAMDGLFAYPLQNYAMFAAFPLALYSGERGPRRGKYLFYWFYPVHILLLHVCALVF